LLLSIAPYPLIKIKNSKWFRALSDSAARLAQQSFTSETVVVLLVIIDILPFLLQRYILQIQNLNPI
jgi:hypothetical protein